MSTQIGARLRGSEGRIVRFPAARGGGYQPLTLERVQEAAERIRPYVRRTPIMHAWLPSLASGEAIPLRLKMENLQVGGEIHTRGVLNFVLTLSEEQRARGVITASWGGVGTALAYAGHRLGFPATVFVSGPALSQEKQALLERWGARVVVKGADWTATHRRARALAEATGQAYLHPFAEPELVVGNSTVVLEILGDEPDLTALLVSGDGGGVALSAAAFGLKSLAPTVEVVGVEVDRVARLHHCVGTGRLADFPLSNQYFGPPRVSRICFDLVREHVDRIVLVTDREREESLRVLWSEMEVSAGVIGATAVTGALWGHVVLPKEGGVCAIIGSAGEDGLF